MVNNRPSKNYMELLRNADKDMYKFWNTINDKAMGTYPLGQILLKVLQSKIVIPDDVKNLFTLNKEYPGTTLTNCSGMPVLTVKLN